MRIRFLALPLLVVVAGCGSQEPASKAPVERAEKAAPPPLGAPQATADPAAPTGQAAAGALEPDRGADQARERLPSDTIPERYRGGWDASGAACGGRASELRLVIGPSSLRFHESGGEVLAVRGADGDGIAVDMRLTGEGATRVETRHLRLTPERQLSVETQGRAVLRVRCPG